MATADAASEPIRPDAPALPPLAPAARPADAPIPRPSASIPTPLALVLLFSLLGFIAYKTPQLIAEFRELQREQYQDVHTRIIGYEGINPYPMLARRPADWYHRDGDFTMIWATWERGVGHRWFRARDGEVERERLSWALGRDVFRAIDQPVVEVGGGERWNRIPSDSPVYGIATTTPPTVYPALVLQKVLVVNEQVESTPLLVLYTPLVDPEQAVDAFDPRHQNRRITMGTTGYLYGGRPLLYDRGTESLWAPDDTALVALAGPLRGASLARLAPMTLATWSDWQDQHPDSRLVVGANRRGAPPRE